MNEITVLYKQLEVNGFGKCLENIELQLASHVIKCDYFPSDEGPTLEMSALKSLSYVFTKY